MKILEVAIIGGGQTALSLSFALRKAGVTDVALFESAPEGLAGPWLTTARMRILRSPKEKSTGPALGSPHLTFRAWYEETQGDWESLGKIPTELWAEYLNWFRATLSIDVHYTWQLLSIVPEEGNFRLIFEGGREVRARRVVLATGRGGFGGLESPEWVASLPRERYFHTGEMIPLESFLGKRVAVLGAGSSAFDAAATALENGAAHVHMLMRRECVPQTNHLGNFPSWEAFSQLDDETKLKIFENADECGHPPPSESIQRIAHWKNFTLHADTEITSATSHENELTIGPVTVDLLILATGYAIDVRGIPEISSFHEEILLWSDKHTGLAPRLGRFPYLGEHLEFLERRPGSAPYLKNLYCFNYGSFLSHGRTCDIDTMESAVRRLAHHLSGGKAAVDADGLAKDK